jgi:hypothetical protein
MMLTVADIVGLPGIPGTARGVRNWLPGKGIPLRQDGRRFTFNLADLPDPIRVAYQARLAERSGLAAGVQDEAAHLGLMAKPIGTQKRAHDRAAIMAFVAKH